LTFTKSFAEKTPLLEEDEYINMSKSVEGRIRLEKLTKGYLLVIIMGKEEETYGSENLDNIMKKLSGTIAKALDSGFKIEVEIFINEQ